MPNKLRRRAVGPFYGALVPAIGPPTVEQTDSYLASLDIKLDDEVSRIDLGQPHDQIAERVTAALGGDASGFTAPRIPRA